MTSFRTTSIRCDVLASGCHRLFRGSVVGVDVGAGEARDAAHDAGWRRIKVTEQWQAILESHGWSPLRRSPSAVDVCPACRRLGPSKVGRR